VERIEREAVISFLSPLIAPLQVVKNGALRGVQTPLENIISIIPLPSGKGIKGMG